MDRRSFALRLALAVCCFGRSPPAASAQAVADPWQRQARRLAGLLRHRASARRIGRAYLRAHPAEARIEALVAGLTAGRGGEPPWAGRAGSRALRARLQEQIRADFAAGRTVGVRGWVLAESEARLFALAALSAA